MVRQLINDKGNPAANQFTIRTAKALYFQSYRSVVCKICSKGIVLSSNWDYSNTTRKHLYIFLRDNGYGEFCSKKDMENAIKDKRVILKKECSLKIV